MNETNQEYINVVMGLITHAGDAKSLCMEAFQNVRNKEYSKVHELINQAEKALVKAHGIQTKLLTKEASGENVELSLLMIHAQDHLMNAISFKEMTEEVLFLHEELRECQR